MFASSRARRFGAALILAGCPMLFAESDPIIRAEFTNAAQPQLATSSDGRVWVAFGRGREICVAGSADGGQTFGAPVRVAELPSLMLGRRRGPRIVAHGNDLTVTAMAGEFFAFHSKDAGRTWTGPAMINDVRRSAVEGLNGLAVAPDGKLFAVWLDVRGERKQVYASESTDGGVTWSANTLVYRAPTGNVCECCHPSAVFNARGDLAVMWRNAIDGNRDLWFALRPAGTREFGPAAKLGTGSWPLKACPMDGGAVFPEGDHFATVWQRNGEVFYSRPDKAEQTLAKGMQPVALAGAGQTIAVWQQGAELWTTRVGPDSVPSILAHTGRFPAVANVPGTARILVAYERGADSVVVSMEFKTSLAAR